MPLSGQPVVSTMTGENNHIARKSSFPRALSGVLPAPTILKQPV
jgi:hypothetical protein